MHWNNNFIKFYIIIIDTHGELNIMIIISIIVYIAVECKIYADANHVPISYSNY